MYTLDIRNIGTHCEDQ